MDRFSSLLGPWRRQAVAQDRMLEEFQHTLTLTVEPASLYASILRAFQEMFNCERVMLLLLETHLGVLRPAEGRECTTTTAG
jgi:hypothetical protein